MFEDDKSKFDFVKRSLPNVLNTPMIQDGCFGIVSLKRDQLDVDRMMMKHESKELDKEAMGCLYIYVPVNVATTSESGKEESKYTVIIPIKRDMIPSDGNWGDLIDVMV